MAFPFLALIHPDDGLVGNQEEKNMAELDAWYLLGVNKVVNDIDIRHQPSERAPGQGLRQQRVHT